MYKLLLVDDERIIREGISVMVPWEAHGFCLAGAAQNGIEAYEMILGDPPHIVVTDIKMPGLDGLGLVEKVKENFPDIIFIILSGYGEFELANRAMRYGVKHYLLKPCSEDKFIEVLEDVKEELRQKERREEAIRLYKMNLEKVMPLVKEQFLRDFITNRSYTRDELEYYSKLIHLEDEHVRLILFQPEGDYGYEEMYALTSLIHELLEEKDVYFDTIVKNQVLALVKACDDAPLIEMIQRVEVGYYYHNKGEITVAYSEEGGIESLPQLYKEVQEYIKYSLYSGRGSIISKKDIALFQDRQEDRELSFDYEKVHAIVKSGSLESLETELDSFFAELQSVNYGLHVEKTYCMELFMAIIRQCPSEEMEKHINSMIRLQKMEHIGQVRDFIREVSRNLTRANHERIAKKHSKLVSTVIKQIQDNYADENLSLKRLANEVLFMNVGYLSKLFNKEVGEKFSACLLKMRMEKAKELIEKSENDRVYEVAGKIGLGDNPQYFSQVFKKYTGLSPSEYKRKFI